MSRKKQSYLTKSDCEVINKYINDLLDTLANCFRYRNSDNFTDYKKYYYFRKELLESFIDSFNEDI